MSILVTSLMFGCSQSSVHEETVVDANTFEQLINDGKEGFILDVRTPEEFSEGHIPGAVLINVHDDDFRDKINGLGKSKTILVYCAAGIRSEKAAAILKESGYEQVFHLKDGLKSWGQANKRLTK